MTPDEQISAARARLNALIHGDEPGWEAIPLYSALLAILDVHEPYVWSRGRGTTCESCGDRGLVDWPCETALLILQAIPGGDQ